MNTTYLIGKPLPYDVLNDAAMLPDGQYLKLEFTTKHERKRLQWQLNAGRAATLRRLDRAWQDETAEGRTTPLPETGWEDIETQSVESDGRIFLLIGRGLRPTVIGAEIVEVEK